MRQKQQMKREPSYKRRDPSKENFHRDGLRSSQSKQKKNWVKPTQKPTMDKFGTEKETRYIDKSFGTGYYWRK